MEKKNALEMMLDQGQNVLASMKDLKRIAEKKSKDRAKVFERFTANQHSFNVYSYIDSEIEQLAEVKAFKEKLEEFNAHFTGVMTDFNKEVAWKQIEATYEETLAAYDSMVNKVGSDDQSVDGKRG